MCARRTVYDGLWRCLCPSFDPLALARTIHSHATIIPIIATNSRLARSFPKRQKNRVHARRAFSAPPPTAVAAARPDSRSSFHDESPRPHPPQTTDEGIPAHIITCPTSKLVQNARDVADTDALVRALPRLAGQPEGFVKVLDLLRYLIRERKVQPCAPMYEALVGVMADVKGSARSLGKLLNEMSYLGIVSKSFAVHRNALRSLAVHPDYATRNRVLKEMTEHWVPLTIADQEHVVLGVLRDGQYELAMEKLDSLLAQHPDGVSPWVLETFASVYVAAGLYDEALHVLLHRLRGSSGGTPRPELLYLLLDAFARAYHYPGVKYLWDHTAQARHLHVPDGTVAAVSATAARSGDAKLATETMSELMAREAKLAAHHYEALIDLHADRGAVADALKVACIMAHAGVSVTRDGTRRLFRTLKNDPALIEPAVDDLVRLAAKYAPPAAAGNVLIEAALHALGAETALDTYRTLHPYLATSAMGIDTETFRPLVSRLDDATILASLASDFLAAAIPSAGPPDFYDKLAKACVATSGLGDAFAILEKIRALPVPRTNPPPAEGGTGPGAEVGQTEPDASGPQRPDRDWWMKLPCVETLATKAVEERDLRGWELLRLLERSACEETRNLAKRLLDAGLHRGRVGR